MKTYNLNSLKKDQISQRVHFTVLQRTIYSVQQLQWDSIPLRL